MSSNYVRRQRSAWGSVAPSSLGYLLLTWLAGAAVALAQVAAPDRDGDSVPDAQDNCVEVRNAEQFDRDGDGLGDLCDVTVLAESERKVHVPAGRVSRAAVLLAEVANYTRQAHTYQAASSAQQLVPEQREGVLTAGRFQALYGSVDARQLLPGQVLQAQVSVHIDIDIDVLIHVVIEVDEPEPPSTCTYRFYRDFIEVADGEGGFDPALELDDVTIEVTHGTTTSSASFSGTIRSGADNGTDEEVFNETVDAGEFVTLPWSVSAVETDSFDSDDEGAGAGNIEFTCSGSGMQTDDELIVLGNGSIIVNVKVLWDEN